MSDTLSIQLLSAIDTCSPDAIFDEVRLSKTSVNDYGTVATALMIKCPTMAKLLDHTDSYEGKKGNRESVVTYASVMFV